MTNQNRVREIRVFDETFMRVLFWSTVFFLCACVRARVFFRNKINISIEITRRAGGIEERTGDIGDVRNFMLRHLCRFSSSSNSVNVSLCFVFLKRFLSKTKRPLHSRTNRFNLLLVVDFDLNRSHVRVLFLD